MRFGTRDLWHRAPHPAAFSIESLRGPQGTVPIRSQGWGDLPALSETYQ